MKYALSVIGSIDNKCVKWVTTTWRLRRRAVHFLGVKARGEARILRSYGERGSASLYRGSGGRAPAGVQGTEPPVRGQGAKPPPPPKAESSVAFEAPAEGPNLTLVTDSFLQFI